jgi:periplasmic protein TonB
MEQQPAFTRGYRALANFIKKNLRYPTNARSTNVEGTVFISFVTSKDGYLKDVNVVRGLSAECGQEAIRMVKSMPKWIPGRRNGARVNVRYILPVKFRIG